MEHRHACLVMLALLAACDYDVGPPQPRPVAVRIEGPSEFAQAAQVQFTALQTWSDGSSTDVTSAAQWTSSNPSVLSINAGRATAMAAGEVGLTARFQQFTSQAKIVSVVPAAPEWDGSYTLTVGGGPCTVGPTPLHPDLRLRSYAVALRQFKLSLTVEASNVGSFSGRILNPRALFTLSNIRSFARPRRRTAVMELGPVIRVAAWKERRDYTPDYRRAAYLEPPPAFTEVLPDGNLLRIDGEAVTTMSPSGFIGTLNGSFTLYSPSSNFLAACHSLSHMFTLVRR